MLLVTYVVACLCILIVSSIIIHYVHECNEWNQCWYVYVIISYEYTQLRDDGVWFSLYIKGDLWSSWWASTTWSYNYTLFHSFIQHFSVMLLHAHWHVTSPIDIGSSKRQCSIRQKAYVTEPCCMVGRRECIARITDASTTFHISESIQTFRNTSCELLYLDTYQDQHCQYNQLCTTSLLVIILHMMTTCLALCCVALLFILHCRIPTVAVAACKAGVASLYIINQSVNAH